ncbi:hypothetical protein LTR15_008341 [Elasticomyces elasticus]|nr:hypothetical protein LTR15_008341 [Elasticomyces elasticus]
MAPSTPERRATRARTPPSPLHGPQYDNYQPYSPRRSTRATAHNNPYSSANGDRSPPASAQRHTTPPPTAKRARFARTNTQLSSPPSSPASPVRTRLAPQHHKTPRKLLSTIGTSADSEHATSSLAPTSLDPVTMLPTPSKTPVRRKAAALNSTSRVLSFQPEHPNDVMPKPQRIKKHGRFNSMNGFDLYDEDQAPRGEMIEVFTDANARVPELDESDDNPFVGSRTSSRPQRRSARKAPTAEDEAISDAVRGDEGLVYSFRGKKILRRYSDPETERSSTPDTELGASPGQQRTLKRQAGAAANRPLTRSSLKPKLLWPSEEQDQHADDVDEEATTDIEMGNTAAPAKAAIVAQTPIKARGRKQPISPPTTTRATRSTYDMTSPSVHMTPIYKDEPEPMSVGSDQSFSTAQQPKRRSPFDSWQRTKGGRKRAGEHLDDIEAVGKRTRSAVVESPA